MEFPDRGAYRDFWRQHPAFPEWTPDLEKYIHYDLAGVPPHLHSRTSAEAMRADQVELYGGDEVVASVEQLAHPATLLWAPRGLQNETPGLYPPAVIEHWRSEVPSLVFDEVPDTNHYTIVMGEPGASVVAEHVRKML
jgi:hypothetical protein